MRKKINANQIESWVRERKLVLARSAIQQWLKNKSDLNERIQACDWLRRLGELKLAYRVIAPKEFKLKKAGLNDKESRQYLWCARILNLLGASKYALQIAETIANQLETTGKSEDFRVLGNIYLSNYDFGQALKYLMASEKADLFPQSYDSRLARVSICDSLAGLGRFEQAIRRLKKIKVGEEEHLLHGILLQAEGEYLARSGKSREALPLLQKAQVYFPREDESLDSGFLLKWIGISKIQSGDPKTGLRDLNRAIDILGKPSHRPEMVLDCLYWKHQLGLAKPEEARVLQAYPGQILPALRINPPRPRSASSGAEFTISFSRGEWRREGEVHAHLNKEIELLGLLAESSPLGLPIYRAFTLLWPDGLNSFLQLEDRLYHLQKRIRDVYGLHSFAIEKNLHLAAQDLKRVQVEGPDGETRPWVFEESQTRRRAEIGQFYKLKSTQLHHLIREWIQAERVCTRKRGKETIIEYRQG